MAGPCLSCPVLLVPVVVAVVVVLVSGVFLVDQLCSLAGQRWISLYANIVSQTVFARSLPAGVVMTDVQVGSCAQPQQLLQITLNHLEVLKTMVPIPSTRDLIDSVIQVTQC